jgi:ubiquinone/menaquinone biosynthesis C-methylase UbiE
MISRNTAPRQPEEPRRPHGQSKPPYQRSQPQRRPHKPFGAPTPTRAPQETSWGGVSSWYEETVSDPSSYQQSLLLPNIIRLAGEVKGKTIVDVGCGTGLFSFALAEGGARVIGIDPGESFIENANKKAQALAGNTAEFKVGSANALPVADAHADRTMCILALQNIREAREAIQEWKRVLKSGGRAIVVLNHPAFRIPKRSGWGWDEQNRTQYRKLDGYMSESEAAIVMNPGSKKQDVQTASFHRPLQWYFKQLAASGFAVTKLEEWISNKKSGAGPRQAEEDRIRKEIPMFLFLEAIKL